MDDAASPTQTDAGPQLEKGYTRIANELLEAVVRFRFSSREYAIVLAVFRKTFGFGKKADDMTLTQLADMTGIDIAHVSRTVRDLEAKNVLLKRQGRYGYVIGISKNSRNWKTLPKRQPLAESATPPCQNSKIDLPKEQIQKKPPKETTKKAADAAGKPATLSIWDLGESLFGSRSYVGTLMSEFPESLVAESIAKLSLMRPPPADPKAYIRGILRKQMGKATDESHLLDMC